MSSFAHDKVVTLSLAEQLNRSYRQGFSTAILTLASWSSKTWQLAGVPMMRHLPNGDVEFSGRFLGSVGSEGALLGMLLRRLPAEMPVVILCLSSQLPIFKAWFEQYRGLYGNREITLVAEPDPGLDTGGGILLALDEVKTPFVVTMDGNSYIYRAYTYQQYLQVQQEKLARLPNDTVGMIMGVPQEEQEFEVEMSYFKLEHQSREDSLVTGWSERGQADVVNDWCINPGFYAFKTDLLRAELQASRAKYGPNFSMEGHVMPDLIAGGKIRGFAVPWLVWDDIGTPKKFWKRRFTSKGTNRIGDNGLALNCEQVVVHSALGDWGLKVRGLENTIVSLVMTPVGPFLLIHPLEWADQPELVAQQFDVLMKDRIRLSCCHLDGQTDEDLFARFGERIERSGELEELSIWSLRDVRIRFYPDISGPLNIIEVTAI